MKSGVTLSCVREAREENGSIGCRLGDRDGSGQDQVKWLAMASSKLHGEFLPGAIPFPRLEPVNKFAGGGTKPSPIGWKKDRE